MPQVLDGDLLLAFVHGGRIGAKSFVVQAVYAGLEQRITRGDFNHVPALLDPDDPELLRERAENDAWLYGQSVIDGGGETP